MKPPRIRMPVPWQPRYFVTDDNYAVPYGSEVLNPSAAIAARITTQLLMSLTNKEPL